MKVFLALSSTLAALAAAHAGVLDDKSPGYFVDRYGPAESSASEKTTSYAHIKKGIISVPGQFSARKFKRGDLAIEAVFFLPSLRLAAARYFLPHQWTAEQIDAALKAYGGDWKEVAKSSLLNRWEAPDGTVAVYILTTLHFQSKELVAMGEKVLETEDAKRKAVPQF